MIRPKLKMMKGDEEVVEEVEEAVDRGAMATTTPKAQSSPGRVLGLVRLRRAMPT